MKPTPPPFRGRRNIEPEHRLNLLIKASQVRLVQMEDESKNGVFSLSEALEFANELGLDLIEISPNAVPPVCKIMEYSKFKYELKRREKEQKSNQKATEMKEIRFGPNTDEHDFAFKSKHAEKFLNEGNKVRAYVMFRGRSIVYKDRGKELLERFAKELEDISKIEGEPKMDGKKMMLILVPKKLAGKEVAK